MADKGAEKHMLWGVGQEFRRRGQGSEVLQGICVTVSAQVLQVDHTLGSSPSAHTD